MSQALSGIRVLDLSEGIAGPYCAKLLADFGAEVLKIEAPSGDVSRSLGPFPGDIPDLEKSGLFLWLNLNKRGLTLDVFTPTGRNLLDELIATADVLVSSYSPDQIEELGLTYEQLSVINPKIVVAAITPWGLTGPYRDYVASEITLDAWGHAMSAFGTSDREPLTLGGSFRQYFSGQVAALATLGAVRTAGRTGEGQTLDLSMMEAQLGNIERRSLSILRHQYNREVLRRDELPIVSANPITRYHHCSDGWISGGADLATFPRFAQMIGHDEWLEDLRFQPLEERFRDLEVQSEIEAVFVAWLKERTRAEVFEAASEAGLRFTPVNEISDVLPDRHLAERKYWMEVDHPRAGTLTYPGAPFRLSIGGHEQRIAAPLLGQHNKESFCTELGLDPTDLARLSAQGILSQGRPLAGALSQSERPTTGMLGKRGADNHLPLAGVRVLDMTIVWAGPYGTMFLGDLGAEVIRVESLQFFPGGTRGNSVRPKKEDIAHLGYMQNAYPDMDPGEQPWNRWAGFNILSRNKLSVTADLARPEGIEIFKKLVAISDIVIDNFSVGAIERMGLGYEELKKINPKIIQISMPLFGNSGPYREQRGAGTTMDAFSGFLAMRGYRDNATLTQPIVQMDATSGVGSAFAALCALRYRDEYGEGQFIDFSQCENMLHQGGEYYLDYQMNHRNPKPLGNRDRWGSLQGCYPCKGEDNWLAITLRNDADWGSFREVIGDPEWCSDDRFRTTLSRLHNHDAFDDFVKSWTSHMDGEDAMHRLQKAGVPAAKVMNEAEIVNDKHLIERGFFLRMTHPDCGTHLYPGHLWKSSAVELAARRAAPTLGQDNEYVYKQLLRYSDADYERLVAEKHIGTAYVEDLTSGVNRSRNT